MSKVVKKTVISAISGGVDSSVASLLLKKAGYEVIGVFMRLGTNQERDEATARLVCQKLDIKFYPFNFSYKFKQEIINYFIDSYKNGLTPNPCVKCNKIIKSISTIGPQFDDASDEETITTPAPPKNGPIEII